MIDHYLLSLLGETATEGSIVDTLISFAPIVVVLLVFYFMLILLSTIFFYKFTHLACLLTSSPDPLRYMHR